MVLGGCGGTHAQIDWVNFIKVHGIMYVVPPIGDTTVPVSLQGMMATTVHFQIADHISDPTYQANDGDAAFLPVGTPIYQVIGYRETFRLMALWNGHMTLFEASTLGQTPERVEVGCREQRDAVLPRKRHAVVNLTLDVDEGGIGHIRHNGS